MTALATPNTVTIRDVEIVQTGIEYPLSTGPATFTTADLSDLVESQGDPAIKSPRLKLGHTADLGLLADGQPAIGTVGNLRLEQEGHLVVGDYVGVPAWLAEVLPSAYPARSIEAAIGVDTNTGHHWRLVLTDLALLGVVWPGVGTLEDIQALYSADGPDNISVLTTKEEVEAMTRPARGSLRAQVDAEDIRRQYYSQLPTENFWWWIRSMFVDPNELIVEDEDSGSLYRVPFTTKGDEVTFSDPVAVKIVYKDKPASQQDKQTAAWEIPVPPQGRNIAVYANRADSRPEQEGHTVTVVTEVDPVALRNSLGLAEDASEEDVRTALASAGYITPPGHETGGPTDDRAPASEQPGSSATAEHHDGGPDNTAPGGPTDPAVAEPEPVPADAAASAQGSAGGPTGVVTVDQATWESTRRQAAEGAQAFARQQAQERDGILAAAISEGRIPPSRRGYWATMLERDPEGARTLLTAAEDKGGLAKGLVPVAASVGAESPLENTTIDAYPAEWLPEIQRGG
jgi:hypothetical protein